MSYGLHMDTVDIPLHADTPPGLGQVIGWVIAANVFVLVTITVVFVILPWLAGHQPRLDTATIALAGATGFALMLGFLFVAFRRHHRRELATPTAHLRLDADFAELRPRSGAPVRCPRDQFVARPVHAHETLRGVDYFMGPALQLTVGDTTFVVAVMDGKHCWGHDPPAVSKIDWILASAAWASLLEAEELADELLTYGG